MFERFTGEARLVIIQSREHAQRFGHRDVGCGHLLLSIAAHNGELGEMVRRAGATPAAVEAAIERLLGGRRFRGVDREALASIGIDLDLVRTHVDAQFGTAPAATRPRRWRLRRRLAWFVRTSLGRRPGHIRFTPRAQRCLEQALVGAVAMKDRQVGLEHIMLAMTLPKLDIAKELFSTLDVSAKAVNRKLFDRYVRNR